MASSAVQAKQSWQQAQKCRKHLLKQLERFKDENSSGTNLSNFEAIDKTLEQLRLTCMATIFLDFEYAASQAAEDVLWNLHLSINAEYRRILGKLKQNSHAVERRKIENKYNNFLRIAQQFYKGYIQRLSQRYDIKELKRIAHGMDVAHEKPADAIENVPADLQAKLLMSCHSTLIRLGDLARYRIQARHKKSGYETALTYYGLANNLVPHSGYGFHQMAIVNSDEGNHLDVVYHFYRALAVKEPHPMAQQNLEAKFKGLQSSKGPQSSNPSSSRGKKGQPSDEDHLITWFVRLHALFYKGDTFSSQHNEMETEAVHRIEWSVTEPGQLQNLLKMSLVNMAAYTVACEKYDKRKTEPSLRFCQYSLRFNIRFLHILCAALESALNNSICHNENSPETSAENKRASDIIDLLLPIFRIYCIWLAAYRGDLFGSNETLRRVVEPTVRCICRVMTLLCTDKYSQNLASCGSCDYLLPEDIEIRGLLSLTDERVPQPCRPYCLDDGQLKPYLEDKSKRLEPAAEFSARILDTLRCAYFLAEDPGVPITHQVLNNSLVFEYQQGTINNANAHYESMGTFSIAATTSLTNGEDAPMQTTNPITGERVQQKVSSAGGIGSENRKNNGEEINGFLDDADNTVVTMLSPFLDCPSPKSEQSGGSLRDSSYGMHTTTANEVAQELLASYRPESETTADQFITPGKFEPLPWNWVYTPTPRRSQEEPAYTGKDNVAYHKHSSHRLSKDSPPSGDFLEDPFVTPGHRPKTNLLRPTSEFGNPSMAATEAAHRNQLLQSFTGGSSSHSSPFANWAQPQQLNQSMPGQTSSPWARGYGDGLVSSSASGFAHSSSMYHGTPGNGILYGAPSNWGYQQNQFHMHNGGPSQEDVSTLAGRMQIGDAALSYDAKIFEGAMRDAE